MFGHGSVSPPSIGSGDPKRSRRKQPRDDLCQGCRPGPFYHGTRADLNVGDRLAPGFTSNYADRKLSWIYFSGTLDAAIWGCELAQGEGRERIYIVEPTGDYFDDPNLTDKKFPGNPTQSYRSRAPLRVTGEITDWQGHSPEQLKAMKDHLERLRQLGIEAID